MREPGHMKADGEAEVGAEELARVDALLAALPPVEPRSAVVHEVVMRVSAKPAPRAARPVRSVRARWFWGLATASGMAAAALVAVAVGRHPDVAMQEARAPSSGLLKNAPGPAEPPPPPMGGAVADLPVPADRAGGEGEDKKKPVIGNGRVDLLTDGRGFRTANDSGNLRGQGHGQDGAFHWKRGFLDTDQAELDEAEKLDSSLDSDGETLATKLAAGKDYKALNDGKGDLTGRDDDYRPSTDPAQFEVPVRGPAATDRFVEQTIAANRLEPEVVEKEEAKQEVEDLEQGSQKSSGKEFSTSSTGSRTSTISTEAPTFIEPRGYFANTYLPGDAELSWLRAQVAAGLPELGGLSFESLIAPVVQPFDAPRSGALGLSLASDTPSLVSDTDGPRRVTLQLGLKGATQAPTRRSAVNLALVVDVAGIADESERRALWAVAEAVAGQAQPEDRITLVIHTGQAERAPLVVRAARGEVSQVLAEAYETRGGPRPLSDAVIAAYTAVRESTREDAAMGSELVVLVTPALMGSESLAERAHLEALRGVHLSAIGVGKRVDVAAMRTLAFAGQGRAAHLMAPAEADHVVGAELSAAGRVVARAVRLRVKLGDGVQLVSVLGSRRLDAQDAEKVRAAEKKIDLEVERTTGISADRGTDEDGIQIVIPAFMAGDDHVILFDVVVDKPGLVMDVRARFKDLVSLGNGEVSASLTLETAASGRASPRPEQVNVTRNLGARKTSDALTIAARALRAGNTGTARAALVGGRAEVERLAIKAGLEKDPALASDLRLLSAFERALAAPPGASLASLENALRLAARLELGAR